jgi:hypothetical protein
MQRSNGCLNKLCPAQATIASKVWLLKVNRSFAYFETELYAFKSSSKSVFIFKSTNFR